MLSEYLGHCEDAGTCAESGSGRTGSMRIIEPVEAGGRERNVASPQGFERRIELGAQIHAAGDPEKLDDLRRHG
jgi:hypothetical protein